MMSRLCSKFKIIEQPMEVLYKQQAKLNEGFVETLKNLNRINSSNQGVPEEKIQYDPTKYINNCEKMKKPREKMPPQRINTNSNCYSDQELDYRNKTKPAAQEIIGEK